MGCVAPGEEEEDGSEWLTSRPGRFAPGKEPRYTFNGILDGPRFVLGVFGEEKYVLPQPGFQTRTVQPVT